MRARANWDNDLVRGITGGTVVLMRPVALTHHDDGGQRMVRRNAWDDGEDHSVGLPEPGEHPARAA